MSFHIGGILSLRKARKIARALGCIVGIARRSGEIVFTYAPLGLQTRQNSRRRDATRSTLRFLRKIEEHSWGEDQ